MRRCLLICAVHFSFQIAVYATAKRLCERCDGWFFEFYTHFVLCLCPRTKQQRLEERQADVEYELRCLLIKPGQCGTVCITLSLFVACICNNNNNYLSQIPGASLGGNSGMIQQSILKPEAYIII